ncbi:helix-turn-helix domain-containing protein [Bifidobacterium amazonense]|uniref:Helix-turn-helix domain-containing protein n=1 Tax=Bifidobacterium amazonense TaxID=2809027 RepID=A0ABS9VS33_9BIFI|nr:helix-turn-helix transcriptional regulator [Bifidobacterium amazonense]MCH9274891.1 helix-turn-helix domain-containing protein [Bifidobacterium amazonense]
MLQTVDYDLSWEEYSRRLGVNLQRLRNARGLSQERVAFDAGLSRLQYQRLERGGFKNDSPSNPTAKTLIALAEILGVTVNELLPQPWPDLHAK